MSDTLSNRMRALANGAGAKEWTYTGCYDERGRPRDREGYIDGAATLRLPDTVAFEPPTARHIAAFNPAFVLELADLLDAVAAGESSAIRQWNALRDRLPGIASERE